MVIQLLHPSLFGSSTEPSDPFNLPAAHVVYEKEHEAEKAANYLRQHKAPDSILFVKYFDEIPTKAFPGTDLRCLGFFNLNQSVTENHVSLLLIPPLSHLVASENGTTYLRFDMNARSMAPFRKLKALLLVSCGWPWSYFGSLFKPSRRKANYLERFFSGLKRYVIS